MLDVPNAVGQVKLLATSCAVLVQVLVLQAIIEVAFYVEDRVPYLYFYVKNVDPEESGDTTMSIAKVITSNALYAKERALLV